jgi:hypothetical protein
LTLPKKISELGLPRPTPGDDKGHGLFPILLGPPSLLGLIRGDHVITYVNWLEDRIEWSKVADFMEEK